MKHCTEALLNILKLKIKTIKTKKIELLKSNIKITPFLKHTSSVLEHNHQSRMETHRTRPASSFSRRMIPSLSSFRKTILSPSLLKKRFSLSPLLNPQFPIPSYQPDPISTRIGFLDYSSPSN